MYFESKHTGIGLIYNMKRVVFHRPNISRKADKVKAAVCQALPHLGLTVGSTGKVGHLACT